MTREEAIGEITYLVYSNQETMGSAKLQDALRVVTESTRNPLPDPDTGLVPCGCGGMARLYELKDDFYLVRVECSQCYVATRATYNEERATHDWNTAMGWKAVSEREKK